MNASAALAHEARTAAQPPGAAAVLPGRPAPSRSATRRWRPSRVPVHARPGALGCAAEVDIGQAGAVRQALDSPGLPLDRTDRQDMERVLGLDLSGVRVHTSGPADRSACALGARAYTVGQRIVFGAGEYAPHTPAGRRLLMHELGHVRGSQTGPLRVLRQPAGAPVTAPAAVGPTAADFVHKTILDIRAILYSAQIEETSLVARPDLLGERLVGALRLRDSAAGRIATELGGDPALTAQLRTAYRDVVTALLDIAARQSRRIGVGAAAGDTSYDLFSRHQQDIHEWAWPRATPDPRANVLLDQLPASERTQIRTTKFVYQPTPAGIDSYFGRYTTPVSPADTRVVIVPGGPAVVRDGLARMAAAIAKWLEVNTTVTVGLDLGRYGADRAFYRFTRVRHALPRQDEILVERLGSMPAGQRPPSERAVPAEVFSRNGFIRASGVALAKDAAESSVPVGTIINWPDDQFELLQSAIAQVPEQLLGPVRGLMFIRKAGTPPGPDPEAADYDDDKHAINVWGVAFSVAGTPTHATPGSRASAWFDTLIAHEIGHALDAAPLHQARTAHGSSIAEAKTRFHPAPKQGQSGRVTLPRGESVAEYRKLLDRIMSEQAALAGARSLSGDRYKLDRTTGEWTFTDQLPAGETNEFRDATQADGQVRITAYSDKAIREHFAEAFSLYISEPQTLARLRPHIYEYFVRKFPDAARPRSVTRS